MKSVVTAIDNAYFQDKVNTALGKIETQVTEFKPDETDNAFTEFSYSGKVDASCVFHLAEPVESSVPVIGVMESGESYCIGSIDSNGTATFPALSTLNVACSTAFEWQTSAYCYTPYPSSCCASWCSCTCEGPEVCIACATYCYGWVYKWVVGDECYCYEPYCAAWWKDCSITSLYDLCNVCGRWLTCDTITDYVTAVDYSDGQTYYWCCGCDCCGCNMYEAAYCYDCEECYYDCDGCAVCVTCSGLYYDCDGCVEWIIYCQDISGLYLCLTINAGCWVYVCYDTCMSYCCSTCLYCCGEGELVSGGVTWCCCTIVSCQPVHEVWHKGSFSTSGAAYATANANEAVYNGEHCAVCCNTYDPKIGAMPYDKKVYKEVMGGQTVTCAIQYWGGQSETDGYCTFLRDTVIRRVKVLCCRQSNLSGCCFFINVRYRKK